MKNEYDLDSAVTFLLVGLGIGSFLAIVLGPKQRVGLEEIKGTNCWRTAGLQPQQEAKERIA